MWFQLCPCPLLSSAFFMLAVRLPLVCFLHVCKSLDNQCITFLSQTIRFGFFLQFQFCPSVLFEDF